IAALGDKLEARRAARGAGVPIVPGLTVPLDGPQGDLGGIGFPLMLKAAAGGGGRGMRRVDTAEDLARALDAARREAVAAFGAPAVYAERLIAPARHVEVQLLGDRHGSLVCLGERDCSVQRRNQKLVEETPSPAVTPEIRAALFESARRVAGAVAFWSAATVEFLLDADGRHHFLEMNTRLQVEHGVTELVTGLDLVAWQLRVAMGERLARDVVDAEPRGHAIEVRLYAEDPWNDFAPVAGRVKAWRMAGGPGVRVDAGVTADTDVRPDYDPLLAKLMVHAGDRPAAIARLRRVLDETVVGGVQTDAGFFRWLVDERGFAAGDYDTALIAERWSAPPPSSQEMALAARAASELRDLASAASARRPGGGGSGQSAWGLAARREALR
ncbi:MAG: hypothetical protein M3Y88_09155, partial [Chloroflexota bacterium]|nr:hypothetical protein [Chloroflexota bacterium]